MKVYSTFEKILALHSAPTMKGIKPSNLISFPKNYYKDIPIIIKAYNNLLNHKNIYLEILYEYEKYYLILIYNKPLIVKKLQCSKCKSFLNLQGYNLNDSIKNIISRLKSRISSGEFPHEIGIFLGYPFSDVEGFINNKGQNYKLIGYWKVYSNVEISKKLFKQYTDCRIALCNEIFSGIPLYKALNIY